jgi:hypothetical protein
MSWVCPHCGIKSCAIWIAPNEGDYSAPELARPKTVPGINKWEEFGRWCLEELRREIGSNLDSGAA